MLTGLSIVAGDRQESMDDTADQSIALGPPSEPFLSRAGASRYLEKRWGIVRSVPTLNTLACRKTGPRFVKAGRQPLYTAPDLDAWAASLLRDPASGSRAA